MTSAKAALPWERDAVPWDHDPDGEPLFDDDEYVRHHDFECRILPYPPVVPVQERWIEYLESLSERGVTTPAHLQATERLWFSLRDSVSSNMPPPDAAPTDDGGLLMSWDRNGRHFEIELFPDGSYEWFYRERLENISDGDAQASFDELPERLCALLRHTLE